MKKRLLGVILTLSIVFGVAFTVHADLGEYPMDYDGRAMSFAACDVGKELMDCDD